MVRIFIMINCNMRILENDKKINFYGILSCILNIRLIHIIKMTSKNPFIDIINGFPDFLFY